MQLQLVTKTILNSKDERKFKILVKMNTVSNFVNNNVVVSFWSKRFMEHVDGISMGTGT